MTFGPLHISPITSPHGPIELRDGRILWVGTQFYSQNGHSQVDAYEMDLQGGMTKIGSIDQKVVLDGKEYEFCEPYTIELQDGTLLCHMRTYQFSTFQSVSTDGGRTWSKPEKLWEDWLGAPVHLLELKNGDILGTYGFRNEPYGICAMLSKDKGQTWVIPARSNWPTAVSSPCLMPLKKRAVPASSCRPGGPLRNIARR